MQSCLEGKNWVGKCAQATGMTTSLRILSSKAYSNTCERFTRSELKLESVHQESPRSDIFRKRATKPHLKQKHCQKHLTWAKEKNNWTIAQWSKVRISNKSTFCFSFGNQGLETVGRLERHRIQAVWSPVWSFWSQRWFRVPWRLLVLVHLGFIKSKVNATVYQEILKHFMHPSADKLYGDADFLSQQDFSTCPHCQNDFQVLCWPWYYCAWLTSQHAWPESLMESMGYFLETDEKQSIQQSRRAEASLVPP